MDGNDIHDGKVLIIIGRHINLMHRQKGLISGRDDLANRCLLTVAVGTLVQAIGLDGMSSKLLLAFNNGGCKLDVESFEVFPLFDLG